jgi:hypothetical protein
MLGHCDTTTTYRLYSHLTSEGREDVAKTMQEVLHPRGEATQTVPSQMTGVQTGVQS